MAVDNQLVSDGIPRNIELYRYDLSSNCGESPPEPLTYVDMVAGEACYLFRNLRSIAKIGLRRNKWPSPITPSTVVAVD